MKIIDRYVLRNFLISYLIIGFVLIGLYVLVDLTLNSDEFTEQEQSAWGVLGDIGNYYGHQIFVYFRDLSGIITLVSAVVTLTTMNRRNEMTAILASGVSLYRVIWPVIVLGLAFNCLSLLDQELIIPPMADQLVRSHDEQTGTKKFQVWFYRMYGAWSRDDQCRIRLVADASGRPPGPGATDSVLWVVPEGGWEGGAAARGGSVKAVRQTRPGDVLAVYVGQGPEVRVYVKVKPRPPDEGLEAVFDSIPVTIADVAQTGHEDLPTASDPSLARISRGDRVAPVRYPHYQFTALQFEPDPENYRMVGPNLPPLPNVAVVKRHAGTFEPLARIMANSASWKPESRVWTLSGDASMVFLSPPRPGQEYLPNKPDTTPVAPIHSQVTPREIVLRHSSHRWMQYMATADLKSLSESRGTSSIERARSIVHIRFTQPAINMILLLLGVPFVLTRAPVSLWQGILKCVLISGSCFILSFVCQQISGDARAWAVVAAWLPVILFGPLAVLMLDSVKT